MASKLDFEIIDYTEVQSNLGVSFIHGTIIGMLKLIAFKTGIKKAIIEKEKSNLTFILMKLNY